METFRLATPEKFRVGASAEKIPHSIFWDQKGVILSYTFPKGHDHHRRMLQRHFEESVVACSCRKATWIGGELHPPSRQRSTKQGLNCHRIPGGTGNWDTSTSSLFTWPCSERFLVDTLKLSLRGRQFPSESSLGSAVYQSLKHIPKDAYKKCYEKWVGRWQLYLDKEGDYVEK